MLPLSWVLIVSIPQNLSHRLYFHMHGAFDLISSHFAKQVLLYFTAVIFKLAGMLESPGEY